MALNVSKTYLEALINVGQEMSCKPDDVYLYIYIYMALDRFAACILPQKFIFPSFIVKMPKK